MFRIAGPVVARSTADREVPNSNHTLAWREFLWAQEMNIQPRCELVPWEGGVCVSLIFFGAVCWLHTKPGEKYFCRETRMPEFPNVAQWPGQVNVKEWFNGWSFCFFMLEHILFSNLIIRISKIMIYMFFFQIW